MKNYYSYLYSLLFLFAGCNTNHSNNNFSQNSIFYPEQKIQVTINGNNIPIPDEQIKDIEIKNDNGETILIVNKFVAGVNVITFFEGKAVKIQSYDIWGNKAAECAIKNEHPYSGTIWHFSSGLKGIKSSAIITYKEGCYITEKPYMESEISEILNTN